MTGITKRLSRWAPDTARRVKQLVAEIIELADHDALDLFHLRKVELELCSRWTSGRRWIAALRNQNRSLLLFA